MNKCIAGKMRVFFFCALMIFIQLIAMTGCGKTGIVQEVQGFSFYDEDREALIDFTDSENCIATETDLL